jgi:hypothetical protein
MHLVGSCYIANLGINRLHWNEQNIKNLKKKKKKKFGMPKLCGNTTI